MRASGCETPSWRSTPPSFTLNLGWPNGAQGVVRHRQLRRCFTVSGLVELLEKVRTQEWGSPAGDGLWSELARAISISLRLGWHAADCRNCRHVDSYCGGVYVRISQESKYAGLS